VLCFASVNNELFLDLRWCYTVDFIHSAQTEARPLTLIAHFVLFKLFYCQRQYVI
jgi:hypothetical protein